MYGSKMDAQNTLGSCSLLRQNGERKNKNEHACCQLTMVRTSQKLPQAKVMHKEINKLISTSKKIPRFFLKHNDLGEIANIRYKNDYHLNGTMANLVAICGYPLLLYTSSFVFSSLKRVCEAQHQARGNR